MLSKLMTTGYSVRICTRHVHHSAFAIDVHTLRAAGLAFDLKTSAMVMRDIAVCMGPHGLGLQLNVTQGGVVVCEHTLLPAGIPNPGQVRD